MYFTCINSLIQLIWGEYEVKVFIVLVYNCIDVVYETASYN